MWLPFVMLGWSLASGSPGWVEELRGIAAGHTLHFLATAWPSRGGPQLVRTPGAVAAFVQWAYGCALDSRGLGSPPSPLRVVVSRAPRRARGYDTVNTAYVRPAAPAPFQGRGRRLNE